MKIIGNILFILLLAIGIGSGICTGSETRMPEIQVRVQLVSPEVKAILSHLKLEPRHVERDWIYLDVTREEAERIRKAGLQPEIVIEDLEAVRRQEMEWGRDYHTYNSLRSELLALEAAHPTLAMTHVYGSSVQGREMISIKISDNVTEDEAEPEIRWDGNIHGDEKIGMEVAMYLINELLANYGTDPQITALVDNREFWFTPLVNPDGMTAFSRYNANDVDLNRDYGNQWAADGGSTAPYSQPETRAMLNLITDHQFLIGVSGHSGTELFIYAWSYTEDPTYDQAQYHHIQSSFETLTSYDGGQSAIVLYQVNGSSKECDYATGAGLGFTHEMSYTKTPPWSEVAGYCSRNRPGALWIFEEVGNGIHGTITSAQSGEPVTAMIDVVENGWPVFNDPVVGDYHRYIRPGTWTLKVWAQGFETVMVPGVVVPATGSVNVDVTLNPGSSSYAYRVIACIDTQTTYNNHTYTGDSLGPVDDDFYSLGVAAYVIYDMSESHPVADWPGDDLSVVEGNDGIANEGYTLYASNSWQGPWVSLGMGAGTTGFDLAVSGLETARYLKIVDDGDGSAGAANPGFDLDAIVVNQSIPGCGILRLNKQQFTCEDTVEIELTDFDLNLDPGSVDTAEVTLYSDSDPAGQVVQLTETGMTSGIFSGAQQIAESGSGIVIVADGDTVTASYDDADCQGSPQVVSLTGLVDCTSPIITEVVVSGASENSLTVTWTTDEPCSSTVVYGLSIPPDQIIDQPALLLNHTVVITGLDNCTTYRIGIASSDAAGNLSEDNNSGMYYSGTTLELVVMLSADMDTNPGWSYQGQWAWGIPQGASGDPASGYTGSNVVGYNLAGAYANNLSNTYCTTTVFDCSEASQVYFSFYKWLGVESATWDHASIEVSANGGSSWTSIWQHTGSSTTPSSWTYEEYDLSSLLAGSSNCKIRWNMGPTDSSVTYCGWNIDDVMVQFTSECIPTCVNDGDVTGDSFVTAGDAQLAFLIALGSYTPSEEENCAADCNADETVTAGDAQGIFLTALGSGSCADPL